MRVRYDATNETFYLTCRADELIEHYSRGEVLYLTPSSQHFYWARDAKFTDDQFLMKSSDFRKKDPMSKGGEYTIQVRA